MEATIGRKRSLREVGFEDEKLEKKERDEENGKQMDSEFSIEYLHAYYELLFPFEEIFKWLSYFNVNKTNWQNREFSFTLKDDIYVRFKSFEDLKSFKNEVINKNPFKIDIGAIYNIEPKRKASVRNDKFVAEEKELVFDIDISDYDDVRTCCNNAGICNKCWPLMSCAIKVTDCVLRQDFGFEHICWVFSGRRGIHGWVSDQIARKLDTNARSAIIDYLKLYCGNSQNRIKVDMISNGNENDIHESYKRAYDICKDYFIKCSLNKQNLLNTIESIEYLSNQVRDSSISKQIKQELINAIIPNNDNEDHTHKWNIIDSIFQKHINNAKSSKEKRRLTCNRMEIIFSFVYPRLDIEVSRHKNHLLKCPFVIHPKTGKVCSIIDPNNVDSFDPNNQPTLKTLIDEYNEKSKQAKQEENESHRVTWKDTSLKESIDIFYKTFLDGFEPV